MSDVTLIEECRRYADALPTRERYLLSMVRRHPRDDPYADDQNVEALATEHCCLLLLRIISTIRIVGSARVDYLEQLERLNLWLSGNHSTEVLADIQLTSESLSIKYDRPTTVDDTLVIRFTFLALYYTSWIPDCVGSGRMGLATSHLRLINARWAAAQALSVYRRIKRTHRQDNERT